MGNWIERNTTREIDEGVEWSDDKNYKVFTIRYDNAHIPRAQQTMLLMTEMCMRGSSVRAWRERVFAGRPDYSSRERDETTEHGSTAIAIRTEEGVLLASEKRLTSPLMDASSMENIMKIDSHIGCVTSGLMGDSKTLVNKARIKAQTYLATYGVKMTVEGVTQAVSEFNSAGQAMSRPFGVALLFAGCDNKEPHLFHLDPSGTISEHQAKAIGSGSEGAQQSLQEQYHADITLEEAQKAVLGILKQLMKEKFSSTTVEMATVTPEIGYRLLTNQELEQLMTTL